MKQVPTIIVATAALALSVATAQAGDVLAEANADMREAAETTALLDGTAGLDAEVASAQPDFDATYAGHPTLRDLDAIFGFEDDLTVARLEAMAEERPAAILVAEAATPELNEAELAEVFGEPAESPAALSADEEAAIFAAPAPLDREKMRRDFASATEVLFRDTDNAAVQRELDRVQARTKPEVASVRMTRTLNDVAGGGDPVGAVLGSVIKESPRSHQRRADATPKRELAVIEPQPADDMSLIRRAMIMAQNKVKSCYGALLTQDPNAEGSFMATIGFNAQGTVSEVRVDMDLSTPDSFGRCVDKALHAVYTNAPLTTPRTVEIPFALRVGFNSL